MAEVRLKKLLRLYKLRDNFDAVILAVHVCFVERGFHCISCGEDRNEEQECDFGETLPPSWNSLDDVYTLQYRKGNLNSVYIFKALKLGRKLAIYFMEEDESKMYDTNLGVDDYTVASVDYNSFQHTQQLQTVEGIFRQLDRLKTKLYKDLVDKFTTDTRAARHQGETRENRADNQREQPSQKIDDDLIRIPPRRPSDFSREWERPPVGPFGYGDGDRLPGHPGTTGGMLMDPFRSGGMGSMGMYGPQPHPGQLPRGAVPPGARFDPFGPVPPGAPNPDSRSGQFSRPDPDHLPPPGYDDMFM